MIAQRPERSELLMPAGDLAKMKAAILYGADAVYCGTPDLSLRTKSGFSVEELVEGIQFAHDHGKRVYLTLNLYSHNKDIAKLPAFMETIRQVKPDGVIIADPGVFQYVKDNCPELELHVSTQANICSWLTVKYWQDQGASLAVLAREVSFEELSEIREQCPDIKLEAFVHGAMCMSHSGRCLLSNFMSERGANQGNCAHSCRWHYKVHMKMKDGRTEEIEITDENKDMFQFFLEEEYRPGEMIPLEETVEGTYFMNSKDLCLMPVLNDYLRIGVDSLKVEGRHKNAFYAACVARAYRKAIDDYYADPENWKPEEYMRELNAMRSRGYTLAFHNGRLTNHAHDYDTTISMGDWSFGGQVLAHENDSLIMEVRNTLDAGDVLEFLPPMQGEESFPVIRLRLYEFINARTGKVTERASPGAAKSAIRIPYSLFDQEDSQTLQARLPVGTVVRSESFGLNDARKEHIKVRIKSHQMEAGKITEKVYEDFKERKAEARAGEDLRNTNNKPVKEKHENCCGRGCNGCLTFWNDPKYAKAREMLAQKKAGTRLEQKFVVNE